MKRLFGICLIFVSAGAVAQGNPCKEPEYLFIKSASKSELRDAYCSFEHKALSNEKSHRLTQEMIEKKHAMQLDTANDRETSMGELKARTSCRVAAGAVADALSRRFKSKPPSCS
jgi:hypothetical protein